MSLMHQSTPVHLHDYTVPDFQCEALYLHFELNEEQTTVTAVMHMQRNPSSQNLKASLVLNGELMQLVRVMLDGHLLPASDYTLTDETLTLTNVPDQFLLETEVIIKPQENLALSGLYKS
ncbi:MAG: aminopeptidase N, partial [Pseudomonadota bacterium]|nr:aminopeptidase N [Pseudomonadota bacterium]